jgi:hypothetical protein
MQIIVHFNSLHVLNFDDIEIKLESNLIQDECKNNSIDNITSLLSNLELKESKSNKIYGIDIKEKLENIEGISKELISLTLNDKEIKDEETIINEDDSICIYRASFTEGLCGGKGGFGAMLRAKAKEKGKTRTTDFGACRDLSGRRLRHINDEKILNKWKEAQDKGEEFNVEEETQSGIDLWYLGTPNWTGESFKPSYRKRFMKPRRKTILCRDWVTATQNYNGNNPKNKPSWWGCPRGKRCEYAHGEDELRGKAKEEFENNKKAAKKDEEMKKRDNYMGVNDNDDDNDQISDMVLQGLRAAKRARVLESSSINDTNDKIIEDEDNIEHIPIYSWLRLLSGDVTLTDEGELEGKSEFGTVIVPRPVKLGKHFYEVELLTDGLIQIGWVNDLFDCVSLQAGDGVGDDINSWSFDGNRGKKWNVSNNDYGEMNKPWKSTDVIGCCIEITTSSSLSDMKEVKISYYMNGVSLGNAFELIDIPIDQVFYPAISLEDGESMLVNIGQDHYQYFPKQQNSLSLNSNKNNKIQSIIDISQEEKFILVSVPYSIPDVIPVIDNSSSSNISIIPNEEKNIIIDAQPQIFEKLDLNLFDSIASLEEVGLACLKYGN